MRSPRVQQTLVAMLFAFFGPAAEACTTFYPSFTVGTEFRARVTDRGKPIQGIRVTLDSIVETTDADGIARFSDLAVREYFLSVAGSSDGAEIQVLTHGPATRIVDLNWPTPKPIRVRTLETGSLRAPGFYPKRKQPPLRLSLADGISGRVIASIFADENGGLSFPSVTPGIYFLRLHPSGVKDWGGQEIKGSVPVEVSPTAKADHLDVDFQSSSCGLNYANATPERELIVDEACGAITDPVGAVISQAYVELSSGNGETLVASSRSDARGRFELKVAPGRYEMLVYGRPWFPLRRMIRVNKGTTTSDCARPINVRLGAFSTASTAELAMAE